MHLSVHSQIDSKMRFGICVSRGLRFYYRRCSYTNQPPLGPIVCGDVNETTLGSGPRARGSNPCLIRAGARAISP